MIIQPLSSGGNSQPKYQASNKVIKPLSGANAPTYKPGAFVQSPTIQTKETPKSVFEGIKNAVSKTIGFLKEKPREGEGTGAPLGRLLQKAPDRIFPKIPENKKLANKPVGAFQNPLNVATYYDEIVDFVGQLPGSVVQSWGRSLEMVSSVEGRKLIKEGAKNLPQTAEKVKTHIQNKEWGEAITTFFENPALSVALDVSDFIPGALVAKSGIKTGAKNLLKKTVEEAVEEAEKKTAKEIAKTSPLASQSEKVIKTSEDVTSGGAVPKASALDLDEEKVLVNHSSDIGLVREAIESGDLEGARAIYDDISKESYTPSFSSLRESVARTQERQTAQLANEGVKAVKESYGEYQDVVQKMKNFLRLSADKKSPEGLLFREHIPQRIFGVGSDEIATNLGKSENDLMQQMLDELDIQKQEVPKEIKEVGVARSQLPVGTGKEKVSRLEARVKKSLDDTSPETIERLGLSTYREMSKKENIAKAASYVSENPSRALRVLRGEIDAPPGILRNSLYVAMQNLAKGNVDLARKLSSLGSTRLGQELSILTEIDKDSVVNLLSDIVVVREEAFKRKFGNKPVGEVKEKIIKDIQKKVKAPDKYDWNTFINGIETC